MPAHDTDPVPYALALALTLIVEVPIVVTALALARLARGWRAVVAAIVVNLVTHPLVWLALAGAGEAYRPRFVAVETGAVVVEAALLYAWLRTSPALLLLISLVANLASILAGLALSPSPRS
jgi:hypothetical protein